jgi:hypothetical protein
MYKFLIIFHIIASCVFIAVAIGITARSIIGWYKNLTYTRIDKSLALTFMVLLYITLIHGVIMYFFIDPSAKTPSLDIHQAIKQASLRFWVIEHFYVMTFALILSQIGGIFIRKTTIDRNKFAYAAFYYGVAMFITLLSMTFYFIYR